MKLLLKLLFLSLLTSACGEALDKKNVTGIDVSHFQGEINWALIKKSGYSFTYIKVSEGETLTDSKLVENWEGANQAAILQGGYHTGELQAENFINSLKAVQRDYQGFLPPVLDIEAISKGKLIYA
jgi:lysozyme